MLVSFQFLSTSIIYYHQKKKIKQIYQQTREFFFLNGIVLEDNKIKVKRP